MPSEKSVGRGEPLQVRTRAIVLIALSLLTALSAVAFGLALVFPNRIGVRFVPRHTFPAPAVITDERTERLAAQAHQRLELDGAGGRLPIADAMKDIAARGPKAFDPVAP